MKKLEKSLFTGREEGSEGEDLFLVAGPCSAENSDQVMQTAQQLNSMGVKVFRAGLWKPRTRPGSFEGVGSVGLPWLQEVKRATGMKTATEVANTWHVKECLHYGIDLLWLGARTTANPFAVQELADALRGTDSTVLVKNPVNPDVDLWEGALERLYRSGIRKLAAVHRGFSKYGVSTYRNVPQWEIPVELRRRIPEIPLLNDPSHISGNRDLLFPVAQKAMDLSFDGLFIECHNKPAKALSDKNQQITPQALQILLDKLILRSEFADNEAFNEQIEDLRRQIDQCDQDLLHLFEQRMNLSHSIGALKKKSGITVFQSNRWARMLEDRLKKARLLGLSDDFVTRIFKGIHQESMNLQNRIMN